MAAPLGFQPQQAFPPQVFGPQFGYPPRNQNPIQLAPPLYVGDLDENIREEDLFHLFSKFGQIYYIRLMRDPTSGKSRGFAYVNFANVRDAEQARMLAQYERLGNKFIRILYKKNIKDLEKGNIFVKNIDKRVTVRELHQHFLRVGPVLSAKLALDSKGESRGYGYVQYENTEDADKAIQFFKNPINSRIKDQEIEVFEFTPRDKRTQKLKNNIYIKHLPGPEIIDEKILELNIRNYIKDFFKNDPENGEIETMLVKKDEKIGKFCAFICLKDGKTAEKLVQHFQNNPSNPFGEQIPLYVNYSQTRQERDEILRRRRQGANNDNNLFLKNLKPDVNRATLTESFFKYGVVISCDVRRWEATTNTQGLQYGFVAFKTSEEAIKAKNSAIDGEDIKKLFIQEKPMIYPFQNKDQRKKFLSTQWKKRMPGFAGMPFGSNPEMRRDLFNPNRRIGNLMQPPFGMHAMPPYAMPAPQLQFPRLNNKKPFPVQNRFPGQGHFNNNNNNRGPRVQPYDNNRRDPQGGFQSKPRPVFDNPSTFANAPRIKSDILPVPSQQQQPQPQQQQQLPPQIQQPQQQLQQQRPMQPAQQTMKSIPMGAKEEEKPAITVGTLKTQWAQFSQLDKEKQRNILGELLFPLIRDQVGEQFAPKITGMLIDLDVLEIAEIFEFLEDKDLLHERIEEAKGLILSENA